MKEGKSAISGQFPRLVPVPNKGGIGTTYAEAKWYWYQLWLVLVPLTRTRLVPVPVQVVPIPLLPAALISCISIIVSPNSYTNSIGTLVND